MNKSTHVLGQLIAQLTPAARRRGLNDSQWAAAAGVPKETLSRLRRRSSCELTTLQALAQAAGMKLGMLPDVPEDATGDGHFPRAVDRLYEQKLVALAASAERAPEVWRAHGPAFFMGGLAVLAAGAQGIGMDRNRLLDLGERLHPGISEPQVFQRWLDATPLKPSRFLPMVRASRRHAA